MGTVLSRVHSRVLDLAVVHIDFPAGHVRIVLEVNLVVDVARKLGLRLLRAHVAAAAHVRVHLALLARDVLLLPPLLAIRHLPRLGRRKMIIRVIIHGIDIRMKPSNATGPGVNVFVLALPAQAHQISGGVHHIAVRVQRRLGALAHVVATVILRVLSSVCI